MVTPKRVVEATPLVVARIKLRERAQRSPAPALPERRVLLRDPAQSTRLAPTP